MNNNYVDDYGQLIAKRMIRDGYDNKEILEWLRGCYGRVSDGFVNLMRAQLHCNDD